jgi:hypothetical protein
MLRGAWSDALSLQPLIVLIAPAFSAQLALETYRFIQWGRLASEHPEGRAARLLRRTTLAVAVAMIVLWLARFAGFFGGPVPD